MFDSEGLRSIARDLTIKARAAPSNEEKLALASRAKSYLLLAKNAEWDLVRATITAHACTAVPLRSVAT